MDRTLTLESQSTQLANDRRRRNRLQSETSGWIIPANQTLSLHNPADEEAWEVRIHDVSRFGVGFISTQRMDIGEEHLLRIGRGPIRRARLIRIVAWRQSEDGTFSIGAEFVEPSVRRLAKAG